MTKSDTADAGMYRCIACDASFETPEEGKQHVEEDHRTHWRFPADAIEKIPGGGGDETEQAKLVTDGGQDDTEHARFRNREKALEAARQSGKTERKVVVCPVCGRGFQNLPHHLPCEGEEGSA